MRNGGTPRSSIFTGLLLILLGVLLLLVRFSPGLGLGHLFQRYWPVLFILWGVAKLLDHFLAERKGGVRPPLLTGLEAGLLILVVLLLAGLGLHDRLAGRYPNIRIELPPFTRHFSQNQALTVQTISSGAHITIQIPRGDIRIRGVDGAQLQAKVDESSASSTEENAKNEMSQAHLVIEQTGDGYVIHPANGYDSAEHVSLDLDLQLPKSASVSVSTSHGDVSLSGISGKVAVQAQDGDVNIQDCGADVNSESQNGDVKIAGIAGDVHIAGSGDDVAISDVGGDASISGAFYGSISIRNVAKTTHFASPRSDVMLERMSGHLELDSSDVEIVDVAGDAKIVTHNEDVNVKNVAGRLDLAASRANIDVNYPNPPRADVSIADDSGEVELTLPSDSGFQISAASRSGEIESEFQAPSLQLVNDGNLGRLNGQFGAAGPKITITTTYGTIRLRKSH
jgi:DUF4097 and DUF4098 domain-containing protein YvlB